MSEWISIKERLPANEGVFLTTVTYYGHLSVAIRYFIDGLWHKYDSASEHSIVGNVVAWREIPEPYNDNE